MDPSKTTNTDIVISVREDEEEAKAALADPQYFLYFWHVFLMAGLFILLLMFLPTILRENQSLFNEHGGFFTIMCIASVSLTVLASATLIIANYLLQTWMKNIYYTSLKSVGCFSATLAPFSLALVLFVPNNHLSWIVSLVISLIIVLILVLYYFLWRYGCRYQPVNLHKDLQSPFWLMYLALVAPLLINSARCLPPNLHWTQLPANIIAVVILLAVFMILIRNSYLNYKQSNLERLPTTCKI